MQIGSPRIDESRLHYSRTSSRTLYDPTAARIVRLSETGFGDDGETILTRIKRRRQPRLAVILYGRGKCIALVMYLHWQGFLGSIWPCIVAKVLFLFAFRPSRFSADRTRATEHLHIPLCLFLALGLHITPQLVKFTRSRTQITRCDDW